MNASGAFHAVQTTSRLRRCSFFVWSAILALALDATFVGVTMLTIAQWLAGQNAVTTPVGDLSFFALGGIIVGVGLTTQVWAPTRHIAGIQQAIVGLFALVLAGLLGARIEPLVGGVVFLLAVLIVAMLHPSRGAIFGLGRRVSAPLLVASLLAVVPAIAYAASMLSLARRAGASCFLGRCARGDRFAEMAACALAILLVGFLAAWDTPGRRIPALSAGMAAVLVGSASLALPSAPGSLGLAWGGLAIAWGIFVVAISEMEVRQPSPLPAGGA